MQRLSRSSKQLAHKKNISYIPFSITFKQRFPGYRVKHEKLGILCSLFALQSKLAVAGRKMVSIAALQGLIFATAAPPPVDVYQRINYTELFPGLMPLSVLYQHVQGIELPSTAADRCFMFDTFGREEVNDAENALEPWNQIINKASMVQEKKPRVANTAQYYSPNRGSLEYLVNKKERVWAAAHQAAFNMWIGRLLVVSSLDVQDHWLVHSAADTYLKVSPWNV